jgi:transcriptional regulator with XRE-family HTH domain/mannose-6-phosphate isomerase-like protein (cupin superfamily)
MNDERPIARMREKAGLTQSELAKRLDVSENTIANWEKGGAAKWIGHLSALCKELNCRLEDLIPQEEDLDDIEYPLTDSIIESVKRYCNLRDEGNEKAAAKIVFGTMHDRSLRYWLDQADKAIEQYKEQYNQSSDHISSCGVIINTLVLQDLSVKFGGPFAHQTKFDDFCRIIAHIQLVREDLKHPVHFSPDKFTRIHIHSRGHVIIYMIGWEDQQISSLHHHGNSLDAIFVIEGEMTHWVMTKPEAEIAATKEGLALSYESASQKEYQGGCGKQIIRSGQWVFIDRHHYHQIKNTSGKRLLTLHFRLGAPPEDEHWMEDNDRKAITWKEVVQYSIKF